MEELLVERPTVLCTSNANFRADADTTILFSELNWYRRDPELDCCASDKPSRGKTFGIDELASTTFSLWLHQHCVSNTDPRERIYAVVSFLVIVDIDISLLLHCTFSLQHFISGFYAHRILAPEGTHLFPKKVSMAFQGDIWHVLVHPWCQVVHWMTLNNVLQDISP